MPSNRTLWMIAAGLAVTILVLTAIVIANRPDPGARPYLKFTGGGFVFNYRIAEIFYGFTARIVRPIDVGTVLEAEFEDPAGGDPIVVRQRIGSRVPTLTMRTPAVTGVVKGRSYKVVVRLRRREGDEVFAVYEKSYSSNIGEEVMPKTPLTVGPGYHRPPETGSAPEASDD